MPPLRARGPRARRKPGRRPDPYSNIRSILQAHARYLADSADEAGRRACFKDEKLHGYRFTHSVEQAHFQGADLTGCTFAPGVDVNEADFSGADLSGVDLSGVKNLREHRLGAANLQYARLPDGFAFEGIATIRDLSGRAEKLVLALLASCATVLALTYVSSDDQLFLPAARLSLPVLGMSVPVRAFYYLAPWLLLAPYIFLLSTVQQIWSALRDAPAVLPSGRAVFREVSAYPNFCVMPYGTIWPNHRKRGDTSADWWSATLWDRIQASVLLWFFVPLAILGVWLSYLPRHGRAGTVLESLAVLLAFGLSLRSYAMMRITLSRGLQWKKDPPSGDPVDVPTRTKIFARGMKFIRDDHVAHVLVQQWPAEPEKHGINTSPPRLRWQRYGAAVATAALGLALVSLLAIKLTWCDSENARRGDSPNRCYVLAAHLEDAQFDSLELDAVNLRRAWLREARLRGADLEDADLRRANLTSAQLSGVWLKDAHLEGAIFWEADLTGANLKDAHLEGADLRGATLTGALLQGAHLAGANLLGAQMDDAVLCGAKLTEDDGSNPAVITARQREVSIGSVYVQRGLDPRIDIRYGDTSRLGERGKAEMVKWTHAYAGAQTLRDFMSQRTFSRRGALRLLRGLNVSMGQATERKALELESAIRDASGSGPGEDRAALDDDLRDALQAFLNKVREKAQNHCVATRPLTVP